MRYELVDVDVDIIRPLFVPPSTDGLGLVFRRDDRIIGFALRPLAAGSRMTAEEIAQLLTESSPLPARSGASPAPVIPSPEPAPRSLSVVVCTRDRPELLERCLVGITEAIGHLRGVDHEIIVVDNAPSDDGTHRAVAAASGVRYLLEPVPGLDVARNRALRAAKGDIVAFTDDDAVVDRWWAVALMEAWSANPAADVITGSVLPYELETDAQVLFEKCGGFTNGFQPLRCQGLPAAHAWLDVCGYGAGCNMSVLRRVAVEMGGFDENLDTGPPLPGGGDLDLFYRVARRGGTLIYAPSVAVHHQHRRTMQQLRRQHRSWGTTWMTCVMHGGAPATATRREAWSQAFKWVRWQLGRLGAPHLERMLVVSELVGAVRGAAGEYGRSERRMARRRQASADSCGLTVAVLPWGHVIEDYLDGIGVSLDGFVEQMSGGWLFGYVEALEVAGFGVLLVIVSSSVRRPERRVHGPTGATMWLLPASNVYHWLRRSNADPYAFDWRAALSARKGTGRVRALLAWAVSPWASTPMRSLRAVLRAEACDVLVCQEYEGARFDLCVAFRRLLGVRVFATFQGGSHTRRFERPVRGWSLRRASGLIIADERETARVVEAYGVDRARIARIPNPLALVTRPDPSARAEARVSLGLDVDAPVALWYGRVDRYNKGLDILLDAWTVLRANWSMVPPPVLLLVGTGPDADWLRTRIEEAPAPVFWHDQYVLDRRVLHTRLAASDVFVQPSRHEGFAVAPMEAMAAALPVIATDASGVRHLFGDIGGMIVAPEPRELANAIADAFADPVASRALGERGYQRISSEFSPVVVGRALRAFLGGGDVPVG